MNHYEELGLTPEASSEEIHGAYRNLARMLHPDQHQEEPLKRLAEAQMRRLNGIRATLADPVKRRKYDLGLGVGAEVETHSVMVPVVVPGPEPPPRRCVARFLSGRGAWAATAMIGAATVFSFFRAPAPPAIAPGLNATLQAGPRAEQGGAAPSPGDARPSSVKPGREGGENEVARRAPDSAGVGLEREEPAPAPAVELPVIPLPKSRPPPLLQPAHDAPTTPGAGGFAGTWFYLPPKEPPNSTSLYPPEYIEAVIIEADGLLSGRYRARYIVADRPISPLVVFRFEGKADDQRASLPWSGTGGARGEVRLKLLSQDRLEVRWSASELGTQMDLAAGAAVLIRRQAP